MKILNKDLKHGVVKVKADTLDDLWTLYTLLLKDDLVSAYTERKVKIGGENDRNSKTVRKKIFVKIKVSEVEFSKHSQVLRIQGTIIEGPEDISHGSHHTINVELGTELTISKEWKKYELEKLVQAKENTGRITIICVFDREDCIFAKLTAAGIEKLAELKGNVAKKDKGIKGEGNFYKEITKKAKELNERFNPKHLVFGSPGFFKDYLVKELDKELNSKAVFATSSSVSMPAILEVVKRPELKQALKDDITSSEENIIEELLKSLSEEKASIGLKEVTRSVNEGKCKELIVSEHLIQKLRQENNFNSLETIMKTAESTNAKVHLIGSSNATKKLDGIGGVGSIDRW